MASNPQDYRPPANTIPTEPGVYRFLDAEGRVIYVGKAKNLRNRINSYFQPLESLAAKVRRMVTTAVAVKWVVVSDEVAALSLEYTWIKEFQPFFNVIYRDDKSYPYLALTLTDSYPKMHITRERKRKGTRYFGPYTQVWAIRQTMDQLRRVFPIRNCSNGVFQKAKAQGRPCLQGYIERCCAPCVGRVTEAEYAGLVRGVCDFLDGKDGKILVDLKTQMHHAAESLDFESAAELRDKIAALQTVLEKNTVVLPPSVDIDIFASARDDIEIAIQVFFVRAGRIRGERAWIVSADNQLSQSELWADFLQRHYGQYQDSDQGQCAVQPTSVDDIRHLSATQIPPEICIPVALENGSILEAWLGQIRGAKVQIRHPKRGDKAELLATVAANAQQSLEQQRLHRIGDLNERSAALNELVEYLDLRTAPLRIEAYDISHTQGKQQMGSMVVFEDGAPKKKDYRIFKVLQDSDSSDDTRALREVLRRRFERLEAEQAALKESLKSGEEQGSIIKQSRFSYSPDLLVIDGGVPQVNAAAAELAELGVTIPVIGLAKRMEEVWHPQADYPLILPRQSRALYLLQALRDESHRFAIKAHRRARAQALKKSRLDNIPGLGASRQKALLQKFGSLAQLAEADAEQIRQVPGIGAVLAENIVKYLQQSSS